MAIFYFAWVDAPGTGGVAWDESYARFDEQILSFRLEQTEGDFAALTVEIKNPRVGLLGAGRKRWAWFAYDLGDNVVRPRFFGRLTGIPTSAFDDVVKLEFIARPADLNAQKIALNAALRVLPYWDELFIDEQARADLDLVLEGYGDLWHPDPITHVLSHSDVLIGEDGIVDLPGSDLIWGGLSIDQNSAPVTSVTVDAKINWTQQARGQLDLTDYIVSNWPNETAQAPGIVTSFTFQGFAQSWPQPNASIGDGWVAAEGSGCVLLDNVTTRTRNMGSTLRINWNEWGGGQTEVQWSGSDEYLDARADPSQASLVDPANPSIADAGIVGVGRPPEGSIELATVTINDTNSISRDKEDGDILSWSRSQSWSNGVIPLGHLKPTLVAGFAASRGMIERVTFTLTADLQAILTEPGDDQAALLTFNSADASLPLSDGSVPIGDPGRRSYVTIDRGRQSLLYLIARARAQLRMKARAVEITHQVKPARMHEITLRKNARFHDPRLPGGEALGKVTKFTEELNGDDGEWKCTVTIGCAVGKGGTVSESPGEPVYIDDDYIEDDYQEHADSIVTFNDEVGYTEPLFAPNDDGLEFVAGLTVDKVIDQPITFVNPPASQRAALLAAVSSVPFGIGQDALDARTKAVQDALAGLQTVVRFKLKSATKGFTTDYAIVTTQLKVPTMIDLEAP